jgi:hypothetical protein
MPPMAPPRPPRRDDPEALIKEARDRQRRRRRSLAAVGVVVVAALVGFGIDRAVTHRSAAGTCTVQGGCGTAASSQQGAGGRNEPLYGFARAYPGASTLSRVDPKTLEPIGTRLHFDENFTPGSFSPDGTRLLMLNPPPSKPTDRQSGLLIVDLTHMKLEPQLEARLSADLGSNGVAAASWPTPNQVLVVAQQLGRAYDRDVTARTLLAINARTGAVEWRRPLSKKTLLAGAGTVDDSLVLIGEPSSLRRNHATITVISGTGQEHSSTITLKPSGYFSPKRGAAYGARLVVTSGATPQAYILGGGGEVYSVDPTTGKATLHIVKPPSGMPSTSPPDLLINAAPLENKIVATSFFPLPDGHPAAGIYLIDPGSWTAKLIDPQTRDWQTTNTNLVTFTNAGQFRLPQSRITKGNGIDIYDANGRLLHHLYGAQAFQGVGLTPTLDYAVVSTQTRNILPTTAEERARAAKRQELLFNPTTGTTLGAQTATGPELTVLYRSQPDYRR